MTPPFRSLMAAEFDRLPAPIRELYDRHGDCRAEGCCRIELGGTRLAPVLATLMLLPPEGSGVAL